MYKNTKTSYGSVAKFLHWLIAVLVIRMLIFGLLLDSIPEDYKRAAYGYHKLTGLLILALMTIRLVWAIINIKPKLAPNTTRIQKMAEHMVHGLLYLTLILMPIVGWIGSSAAGRPPMLFGMPLALPAPQDKDFADFMFDIHAVLAYTIIALLVMHIFAALYHQYYKKDGLLSRMLPKK